eukprot:evm.model.scf_1250.4 EVM.evm.TU.scf_1250.4   scf_1250:16245-18692(+)
MADSDRPESFSAGSSDGSRSPGGLAWLLRARSAEQRAADLEQDVARLRRQLNDQRATRPGPIADRDHADQVLDHGAEAEEENLAREDTAREEEETRGEGRRALEGENATGEDRRMDEVVEGLRGELKAGGRLGGSDSPESWEGSAEGAGWREDGDPGAVGDGESAVGGSGAVGGKGEYGWGEGGQGGGREETEPGGGDWGQETGWGEGGGRSSEMRRGGGGSGEEGHGPRGGGIPQPTSNPSETTASSQGRKGKRPQCIDRVDREVAPCCVQAIADAEAQLLRARTDELWRWQEQFSALKRENQKLRNLVNIVIHHLGEDLTHPTPLDACLRDLTEAKTRLTHQVQSLASEASHQRTILQRLAQLCAAVLDAIVVLDKVSGSRHSCRRVLARLRHALNVVAFGTLGWIDDLGCGLGRRLRAVVLVVASKLEDHKGKGRGGAGRSSHGLIGSCEALEGEGKGMGRKKGRERGAHGSEFSPLTSP